EITSEVVVSCWKKCLNKAKEYWETIEVGIGDESDEDSNTDTNKFDQL
ncbi:44701_t:CDS:1, partial [Gigaspora margarita]